MRWSPVVEVATHTGSSAAVVQRSRWSRVLRGAIWLVAIVLAAFGIVAALVVIQGMYGDVRQADAILVWPDACASESAEELSPCAIAQLDYALELYRRHQDYIAHIILPGGQTAAPQQAYLLGKGFPEQMILLGDQDGSRLAQLRQITQLGHERGVGSVLVVGAPTQMLLALKMVRDLNVAAYSAPLPDISAFAPLAVVRESAAYWRYILLGS